MKQHTTLNNNSVPRIERHKNHIADEILFVVPKDRWIAVYEDKKDYENALSRQGISALTIEAESVVRKCYQETDTELPKEFKHFPPNAQVELMFHKDTGKLIRLDVSNHHICFMKFADEDTHKDFIGRIPQ